MASRGKKGALKGRKRSLDDSGLLNEVEEAQLDGLYSPVKAAEGDKDGTRGSEGACISELHLASPHARLPTLHSRSVRSCIISFALHFPYDLLGAVLCASRAL